MLIDAKNTRVAAWYASYGALPLLDAPLSLVLPLRTVEAATQGRQASLIPQRLHRLHDGGAPRRKPGRSQRD